MTLHYYSKRARGWHRLLREKKPLPKKMARALQPYVAADSRTLTELQAAVDLSLKGKPK